MAVVTSETSASGSDLHPFLHSEHKRLLGVGWRVGGLEVA